MLVAGSVVLGSWVVNQAQDRVEVYAATQVLTPGEQVSAADLDVVQVNLSDLDSGYLQPGGFDDGVIVRTVGAGELIPAAAIGDPEELDLRPVAFAAPRASVTYLQPGKLLDVWVAWPIGEGPTTELGEPELLLTQAEVAMVNEDSSLFTGSDQVYVQVLVPTADLPTALAALSAEAEVTLVPHPGG